MAQTPDAPSDKAAVPGPVPSPDMSQDSPDHPGFLIHGADDTPGHKAYYIHLQAKPGQEDALQKFLSDINAGLDREPLTGHGSHCGSLRQLLGPLKPSQTLKRATPTTS